MWCMYPGEHQWVTGGVGAVVQSVPLTRLAVAHLSGLYFGDCVDQLLLGQLNLFAHHLCWLLSIGINENAN